MRAATTSVLTLIDTQLELIENLNCRLEEVRTWETMYPSFITEISELHCAGIALGEFIRDLDVNMGKTRKLVQLLDNHNAFVIKYDTLWRTIQGV